MSRFNWLLRKLLVSTAESLVPAFRAISHSLLESMQPSLRLASDAATASGKEPVSHDCGLLGDTVVGVHECADVWVATRGWDGDTSVSNQLLGVSFFKIKVEGGSHSWTRK